MAGQIVRHLIDGRSGSGVAVDLAELGELTVLQQGGLTVAGIEIGVTLDEALPLHGLERAAEELRVAVVI